MSIPIPDWIVRTVEDIRKELEDRSLGWDGCEEDIQLEIENELQSIIAESVAEQIGFNGIIW